MDYISKDEFSDFKKEFEDRVRSLGKRAADLEDRILKKLQDLESRILLFDMQVSNFYLHLEKLDKKIENIKATFESNTIFFDKSLHNAEYEIAKCNQRIDVSISFSTETSNKIEQNLQSNVKIRQKLNDFDEIIAKLLEFNQATKQEFSKTSKDLEDFKNQTKTHKSSLMDLFACVNGFSAPFCDMGKKIKDLEESFSKNTNQSSKVYEKLRLEIIDLKNEFESQIYRELGGIEIPDVSGFIDRKELNDIKHDVHLSGLEAKNATLKAANLEMQNSIHIKKLENLQLKVDRLELTKQ